MNRVPTLMGILCLTVLVMALLWTALREPTSLTSGWGAYWSMVPKLDPATAGGYLWWLILLVIGLAIVGFVWSVAGKTAGLICAALVLSGLFIFGQTGGSLSGKRGLEAWSTWAAKPAATTSTGSRRRYRARYDTNSLGMMPPIILKPGEESVAIGRWQGRHLIFDLADGAQKPHLYSLLSHEGKEWRVTERMTPWIRGCADGAWWYRLHLPKTATNPVTVHVQRGRGASVPDGRGCW